MEKGREAMKKLFSLLLVIIMLPLIFASCNFGGENNGGNNQGDLNPGDQSNQGGQNNSGDQGNSEDSNTTDYGTATVFAPGDNVQVVAKGNTSYAYTFCDALNSILSDSDEQLARPGTEYSLIADREIVLGLIDEERPATIKAKYVLDRMDRSTNSSFELRYVIYAESGCIAFAYDENEYTNLQVLDVLTDRFIEEYITGKKYIALGEGLVDSGYIDLIEAQAEIDAAMVAEKWAALEEKVGKEITDAFRTYYSMLGDNIVDWAANLYDPGVGGYYAASPGRDNVGYGPDAQNTVQMIRFIIQSGMVDNISPKGDWREFLPEDMQHRLIYLAKSIQDPNGYFYHPQWGKAAVDAVLSRRGRDLGWATGILGELGSAPQYNAPNGTKGDGVSADEYWEKLNTDAPKPYTADKTPVYDGTANAPLTESLNRVIAKAVSKVVATSSSSSDASTAYLKNYKLFMDYLLGRIIPGMHSNPYTIGNEVGETYQQIKIASQELEASSGKYAYTAGDNAEYEQFDGMNLSEMTIHALDISINPVTGLWGDLSEGKTGTEFAYTNGFMKAMAAYNGLNATFPVEYMAKAANALMEGLMSDEESLGNICSVYNVWVSVERLQINVAKLPADQIALDSEGNQIINEETNKPMSVKEYINSIINEVFAEKAAYAIMNSYNKMLVYKKSDGGFGHVYNTGTATHQNLPVSTGENLSDVDATCIASTGSIRTMFSALGLTSYKIPLYTESDWMRYLDILLNQSPVIKHSGSSGATSTHHDFENSLPDSKYLSCTDNGVAENKFIQTTLGDDGVGFLSKFGAKQAYFDFKPNYTASVLNSVVFETDLMFSNIQNFSEPIELRFYAGANSSATKCYILYLSAENKSGNGKIYAAPSTDSSNRVEIGKVGEWFKLRFEYHEGDSSNAPVFKVFINGSETPSIVDYKYASGSDVKAIDMAFARLVTMISFKGEMYIDDLGFLREKLEYKKDAATHNTGAAPKPETPSTPENPGENDKPTVTVTDDIITFDGISAFPITTENGLTISNGTTAGFRGNVSFKSESDGNSYLSVEDTAVLGQPNDTDPAKDAGQCVFNVTRSEYGTGSVFVFEADFRTTPLAESGTLTEKYSHFDITFRNSAGKRVYRTYFGAGSFGLNGAGSGTGFAITAGEWYNLRIEYSVVGESASSATWNVKLFVNDTLVCESTEATMESVYAASADITSAGIILSKSFVGNLDIDNVSVYKK